MFGCLLMKVHVSSVYPRFQYLSVLFTLFFKWLNPFNSKNDTSASYERWFLLVLFVVF